MTFEFLGQFSKMLNNLSGLLDKVEGFAGQRKYDPGLVLNARLAPDQFDLTRQVQIACDTAKGFAARLSGKETIRHEDNEKSIAELKQRIQKTIQYLKSFKAEDFKGWEIQKVLNPRKEGKFLPGNEFFMEHGIPNFYFHVTTAYAILRHIGVEIGKKDYLGEIRYRDL